MTTPAHQYTDSFGFQWVTHARTQLDSVSGVPVSRTRLFAVTGWPTRMVGVRILEAGSGAGRFTEVLLATGATVFSFDPSRAVEANRANNGTHPNLHLFQADIFSLPNDLPTFDKVLCLGVLQHTPDPERAFHALVPFVAPGGEIVIDVYRKSITALLSWKYLLRPVTKRIPRQTLYRAISLVVPLFLPLARWSKRALGVWSGRLFPIADYSHLGLSRAMERQWAILDTFDMYSPRYDLPQTRRSVECWFRDAGFARIDVRYGPNGVVGKGTRSL